MYTHAITRKPAPNFSEGLTTATHQSTPNYQLLLSQHRRYIECLVDLGLEVIELPELADYPDAYFVEDVAVITPEIAVISNPGALSRRDEPDYIVTDIARFRQTRRISEPGTLDGGDVLQIEKHFFVGLSERTNVDGAEQLGRLLQEFGYSWSTVNVGAGLHLKSSINYLGQNTIMITDEMAGRAEFSRFNQVIVPQSESYAANSLLINRHILTPKGFPQTLNLLEPLGMQIIVLDVSEVAKMDGGLTCLSLRF